jgi:hypothetical protein
MSSGCALASPTTIVTPYAASDGVNAQVNLTGGGTVKFRNFLLVSSAKGAPGVLVGAVAADGSSPVDVQLSVLGPDGQPVGQTSVTAKPGELAQIGPDGTQLQVSDVPMPPGSTLTLRAQTPSGGTDFNLPVLAPQNQYSSITPSETASPSPSASPSKASPSASPTASTS